MKIFSWGSNSHGQLGQGISFEEILDPHVISINADVKFITGGGKHSVLLTESGQLYTCGDNEQGQILKDKTVKKSLTFQQINLKINILKVSCGWDFNLALTAEGEVFGWGGNAFGQLGIPQHTANILYSPVKIFTKEAIDIGTGLRHSIIIGKEGSVFTAGFGRKGQLGISFVGAKTLSLFTKVPSIERAVKVSCGEHHSILCTSENKVFAWGDNKFGQLGQNPDFQFRSDTPLLIEFYLNNIKAVVSGWSHNAILTDDGEVITWGRNDYGQLAELRQQAWKLKSVDQLKGTEQITLGSNHGVALMKNGEVLSWGWNEHGNCGNGSVENIYHPVKLKISGEEPRLIGTGSAHNFFCGN